MRNNIYILLCYRPIHFLSFELEADQQIKDKCLLTLNTAVLKYFET
ncbi:uncharacterized protein METZ01_LOCUS119011 [marine metagenome]|uniref:Uncharacterized protein n=1 Tax=marine metagenome TaxID=408172 RepID=A0A381XPM5_9ZZZZ